ncbi:MAG: response regulator transcription factor [Lachnospiraceae bacterium]|nr:response regulator transcription factor [Lachnospiraceae bacterium]
MYSILIIDDDMFSLRMAEKVLSEKYSCSIAKSGMQAITLLKKGIVPNLILLDIKMPEMDGYETLQAIREIDHCQNLPIIFLTGINDVTSEIKGLQQGAVDFITKPFVKEILLARVERHILLSINTKEADEAGLSQDAEKIKANLTETEWEIALYISKGLSNREIAEKMNYSYGYVKNMVAKIFEKCNVANRRDLRSLLQG